MSGQNNKRKLGDHLASSGSIRKKQHLIDSIGKQGIPDQSTEAGNASLRLPMGLLEVLSLFYSCNASLVDNLANDEDCVDVSRKMVGDILKHSLPIGEERKLNKKNGKTFFYKSERKYGNFCNETNYRTDFVKQMKFCFKINIPKLPLPSYQEYKINNTNVARKYEFFPSKEFLIPEDKKIHYFICSSKFHKMISKMTSTALPKKQVTNSYDSIESITYIKNKTLEAVYENRKEIFKHENKVDSNKNVNEVLLFHGTAIQNIESIIENNFLIDCFPHTDGEENGRKKSMLFGRGIYFSELPGVSLMYGRGLLLCKVLLGKCETFHPRGEIPGDIPEMFDSREIIKNGMGIVHVVKNTEQILPYCIIKLKSQSLTPPVPAKNIIIRKNNQQAIFPVNC